MFFKLAPPVAMLGDRNHDLIATYRALAADRASVIRALKRHQQKHSAEHYYATRARWNDGRRTTAAARAAMFIYLNKTCYNGLWRVNRTGVFNVPIGRYSSPTICDADGLAAAAAALSQATLRSGDYREILADARRGDFAYIDPPYDGTFTGYTAKPFGPAEQAELAYTVRRLAERGVQVMTSNADTPRVRALYAGMRIDTVMCGRSINRDGRGRKGVPEVIVTAGYEASP